MGAGRKYLKTYSKSGVLLSVGEANLAVRYAF